MRSRGLFVVLAGPDGSGKSTLAPRLAERARASGLEALHLHWRPGILPLAGRLVGHQQGDPSTPHAQPPHGRLISFGRLVYYWVDFLIGSWSRILPVRRRGGLVVMERGWWDFVVDRRRYRLSVHPSLIRGLGTLLPAPDIVFLLLAPPGVLSRRKDELPLTELARQNDVWRRMGLPTHTKKIVLDASKDVDALTDELESHLAGAAVRRTLETGTRE